jgi:hypothetical protein
MGGYFSRCELIDTNTKECFICKQDIDSIYDIHHICTECKVNIHHNCFLKIFQKDGTICPRCKSVNTIYTNLDV